MKPRKNKRGSIPIYEETLKIAVAREYLTGNLSYSEIAEKYNLPNGDVPRFFVRWYHENDQLQLPQAADSAQVASDPRPANEQQTDFDKELSVARLKIAALEMMIQIAEQELGIDIRKKSGTKQ